MLANDLRIALRTLLRNPGFAAAAVLTLGLGIGASTALFTVVDGVLLRPLPYPDPDRIVRVWQVGRQGGRNAFSDPNFADLKEQSRSFAALAQVSAWPVSVAGPGEPARVVAAHVSRDFFRVIGVRPWLGRAFLAEEQRVGAAPVAIVSEAFWRTHLGGGRDLRGQVVRAEGRVLPVVGVMPAGFSYPEGAELWVPREVDAPLPSRTAHNWGVVGRLADGATVEGAQKEASAIARRLKAQYGDDTWMEDAAVLTLRDAMVGRVRPTLLVLLGASGVLLLIACANAVNLLLARMSGRRREMAVRMALGAGTRRVVQQLIAESLLLSLAGGALGVALAAWGTRALLALEPGRLPRVGEVGVDAGALGFALALSLGLALALGVLAALKGTGREIRDALASNQRTTAGGLSDRMARNALVVAEIGCTLVLLAGAALLGRSLSELLRVDLGFRAERRLVVELALPAPETGADGARLVRTLDDLDARLRALPGVAAVGGVNDFPLGGNYPNGTFLVLDRPDEVRSFEEFSALSKDPARAGSAAFRVASPGYFPTMGIPLLRGRLFGDQDAPGAPVHAALISASLARRRWPNEDPLGKLIQFGNMDGDLHALQVVGVVGDVREQGADARPEPTIYVFYRQRPGSAGRFHLTLHATGSAAGLIPAARAAVRAVDPEVPARFRTVEEVVAGSVADRRFSLLLLAAFGAAALLLAVAGVYGVTSYLVAQRTREIGVRIAFGARRGDVLRMVLREGARLAGAGLLLGVPAALVLTRLLRSQLYGISPVDPLAYAGGALLLLAVALLASYLPARRAARVDPMTALRAE